MKLMFISDIHGSSECLKDVLKRIEVEQPDKLMICGDVLYHGPRNPIPNGYDPKEVISLLNPLKDKIMAVRGNCDSEVDQMVLEFPMMADYVEVYTEDVKVYMSHGHLYQNEVPKLCPDKSIYAQGHSHVPMIELKGDVVHFNPGSITLPKENHPKTYGIYEGGKLMVKTMDGNVYMEKSL